MSIQLLFLYNTFKFIFLVNFVFLSFIKILVKYLNLRVKPIYTSNVKDLWIIKMI
jgi:hypothetical protein